MMIRGLYIHIPFCSTICSYCDFYIVKNETNHIDKYISYLSKEIEIFRSENTDEIIIDSIFLGGGTPSLLTPVQLDLIITTLRDNFTFTENIEISMESNPASLDLSKLTEYKTIGINRISIGVQSFVKKELGILKRNHSPNLAEKAVTDAISSGIRTVNLDLIFSVPNQSIASWTYSLEKALDLGTNHISTYNLTFEENTPLWEKMKSGKIVKYNDQVDEFMYYTAIEILSENRFNHYEISNFAKESHKCIHNLNTWRSGEYLAFGVSSHGYFENVRFRNINNLKLYYEYIDNNQLPIVEKSQLTELDKLEELIVLGLRAEGLDKSKIINIRPIFFKNSEKLTKELLKNGFIFEIDNKIQLTSKGYALCDTITNKYLNFI